MAQRRDDIRRARREPPAPGPTWGAPLSIAEDARMVAANLAELLAITVNCGECAPVSTSCTGDGRRATRTEARLSSPAKSGVYTEARLPRAQ